jgi:hypothetical protein
MGIALFHLLPESSENFEEFYNKTDADSKWKRLPLAFFIAFGAYSLILLIEKVAFDSHSLTHHDHGDPKNDTEKSELNIQKASEVDKHKDKEIFMIPDRSEEDISKIKEKGYEELGNVDDDFEYDGDETKDTLKNVIISKGKYDSYLQANNLCK